MSKEVSTRSLATGEQLQQSLTKFIQQELRDPRITAQDKLCLNITEVKVSKDLSIADVRISCMPLPDSIAPATDKRELMLQILRGAAGFLRRRLADSSTMRSVPELRFHYDDSLEQSARLTELLAAERTERQPEE